MSVWCEHCRDHFLESHYNNADEHMVGAQYGHVGETMEILRDVAQAGVEFDDPRVGYVTVQIDRETWEALAKYRA